MPNIEEDELTSSIEATRKKVALKIADKAEGLVEALFDIAENDSTAARDRLTAISMLLERSLPRLSVQKVEGESEEERGSHADLRKEVESLILTSADESA